MWTLIYGLAYKQVIYVIELSRYLFVFFCLSSFLIIAWNKAKTLTISSNVDIICEEDFPFY